MFNKVKSALYNVVGGVDSLPPILDNINHDERLPKFPYTRPHFLLFQQDEVQVSGDHQMRPIIVPRDISKLPWHSGYAETVNAGKSECNEDQACVHQKILVRPSERNIPGAAMPYTYFGIFDGHAGHGAAVAAANQLHLVIHDKLMDVIDHIVPPIDDLDVSQGLVESKSERGIALWFPEKALSFDSFIIGALESAFHEMDYIIGEDKKKFNMKGGCTAIAALFIAGKLYVANAGDSRGVRCSQGKAYPMSNDFTPSTEKKRLLQLAALKPELTSYHFTHLEYNPRPNQNSLGRRILFRDPFMAGWAYKTCIAKDLQVPVVSGEGKRSRLLATIGVTRGFGDHEICSIVHNTPIKPFLSSQAEVTVFDIESETLDDSDVLVLGTDGLWDVTNNEKTAEIVQKALLHFPGSDKAKSKYRYTSAAQDLVMHSRGKPHGHNWQTTDDCPATIDDISVFVIPLLPYRDEYASWKLANDSLRFGRMASSRSAKIIPERMQTLPSAKLPLVSNVPVQVNSSIAVLKSTESARPALELTASNIIQGQEEPIINITSSNGSNSENGTVPIQVPVEQSKPMDSGDGRQFLAEDAEEAYEQQLDQISS